MARDLAALGFVVLRFDFSGIGDSKVRGDTLPFEKSVIDEMEEAMNHLHATRGIERFILMGICSGAYISFKTACCDSRVVGAVLINARGHLHDRANDGLSSYIMNCSLARHYLRIALFSSFRAKNWLKAIRGKVDYTSIRRMMDFRLRSLFSRKRKVSFGTHNGVGDLRLLAERGVRLVHIYSEGDEGLDYFHVMLGDKLQEWSASGLLRVEIIRGANHTFTLLWSQEHLSKVVHNWAQEMLQD